MIEAAVAQGWIDRRRDLGGLLFMKERALI